MYQKIKRGAYNQPYKLTKLNKAEFKRAFSTSRPYSADPISGGLAFVAGTAGSALAVPLWVPIIVGVATTTIVFTVWIDTLAPTIFPDPELRIDIQEIPQDETDPTGWQPGIQVLTENLGILDRWLAYVITLLLDNSLQRYEVQDILSVLEILNRVQETYFEVIRNWMEQLNEDGSPLYQDLSRLYTQWRRTGNFIMRAYRLYERKLNISPEDSRIGVQWFEEEE